MAPGLGELPLEVLSRIRDFIAPTTPSRYIVSVSRLEEIYLLWWIGSAGVRHPLHGLSQTCQLFRIVCCQSLFYRITLSGSRLLPPSTIISYVRFLHITLTDFDDVEGNCADILRNMSNLDTIFWQPRDTVTEAASVLRLVLSLPSLIHFMTDNVSLHELPAAVVSTPARLRTLDISQSDRDLASLSADDTYRERLALEGLTMLCMSLLEVLRIPGESCCLSFLASTIWPRLRELAFRGRAPVADVPLDRVLCAMPHLRVLSLAVVRLENCPLGVFSISPDFHGTLALERLTLADPQPGENIVVHLSDDLTELSLRDVPRYYVRRRHDYLYAPPVLLCRDAIRIIESLPLRGALLRHLEITVREDGAEADLISLLSSSCRNLLIFELHQYREDDMAFTQRSSEEIDLSFGPLTQSLSPMRQLQQLRLNFDLGLPFPRRLAPLISYQWQSFFARQAAEVLDALDWLDSVAFLTTHMSGPACWSIWSRKRSTSGTMEVQEQLFADGSVIDRSRF